PKSVAFKPASNLALVKSAVKAGHMLSQAPPQEFVPSASLANRYNVSPSLLVRYLPNVLEVERLISFLGVVVVPGFVGVAALSFLQLLRNRSSADITRLTDNNVFIF